MANPGYYFGPGAPQNGGTPNTKPMCASAANIQILASISNCGPMVEYIETSIYPEVCVLFDIGIEFKDGAMLLSEGDGLGLVINEYGVKKLFGY
jgi:L-alanine-DL-glutamate epimerase-like enolase superfamily enzyme